MSNKVTCVDIDPVKIKKLNKGSIPIFEPILEAMVLKKAAVLIILTEWKEFRAHDFEEIRAQLVSPIIFDGRNQYNAFMLEEKVFE
jgi:UDP-glucose 6-dehydrogenase